MTSFINLMANDIWSEADITNRTEALIASEFSPTAVAILNRKATGAALGQYQLSPADVADIARYAEVSEWARDLGNQALKDMELLNETMVLEESIARLNRPALDPETNDSSLVEQDLAERQAAQAVIDSASQEALDLAKLRNPMPEAILKEENLA